MKRIFENIVPFLFLMLASTSLAAQELPQLPVSSVVSVGAFQNGITCYIVTNKSLSGFADFALVQKAPEAKNASRRLLDTLNHFDNQAPFLYMASKGSGYSRYGQIQALSPGQAYRFGGVPVSNAAVCDSVCLMLFELAAQNPCEQAIIISGDVNAKALRERMSAISYVAGKRTQKAEVYPYVFSPSNRRRIANAPSENPSGSVFSLTYSGPRPSRDRMNTVLPLMNQLYANILGIVLKNRITEAFAADSVPLTSVRFLYRNASEVSGDERYTLSVRSSRQDALRSISEVASVLSSIDSSGVSFEEYAAAKNEHLLNLEEESHRPMSNSECVDKCIAAYMYGYNLAPNQTVYNFFSSRRLASEKELGLFNDYAKALISPDRNLTLRYDIPASELSLEQFAAVFDSSWEAGRSRKYDIPVNPAVKEFETRVTIKPAKKEQLKIKTETAEPVSGGTLLTYSNGMQVILKKVPGSGRFDYAFLLRGGYPSCAYISAAEGQFLSDILAMSRVAGMSAVEFKNMLAENGISMSQTIGLSDLRLSGSAPSTAMQLLMNSVLAVAQERKPDEQAFGRYMLSEPLRIKASRRSLSGLKAVLDSLIAPQYEYLPLKQIGAIQPGLLERASTYFDARFARFNDGVLVLVGDFDDVQLRKDLCAYLQPFPVAPVSSIRPKINYPMRSGTSTYTVEAGRTMVGTGEQSINIALSAAMPFNSNRYMAFRLARIYIEKEIVASLAEAGMYASVEARYSIYPAEKMDFYITIRPCLSSGLPLSVESGEPLQAINLVRSAINRITTGQVSAADLNIYKPVLLSELKAETEDQARLAELVLARYSLGRDFVSGYAEKVKALTPSQVQDILKALDGGAKVEYIIY